MSIASPQDSTSTFSHVAKTPRYSWYDTMYSCKFAKIGFPHISVVLVSLTAKAGIEVAPVLPGLLCIALYVASLSYARSYLVSSLALASTHML